MPRPKPKPLAVKTGSPSDLKGRMSRIKSGGGLDRSNYRSGMGVIPRDNWEKPLFGLGMEYGYLLAMQDLLLGEDSTQEVEEA